jgi:hypothetical protein
MACSTILMSFWTIGRGWTNSTSRKSDYSKSLNASAGVNSAIKVTNRQARYNFARLPGQTIVSTGLDGDGTGNFRIKISGVVDLTAADFIL